MNPKVTQRDPKRGQGRPKASQKGVQWRPRGTQKYLLAPKRELKGGLYTQKLPINRTSGHYVNPFNDLSIVVPSALACQEAESANPLSLLLPGASFWIKNIDLLNKIDVFCMFLTKH